jgi:hypothetical protein
LDVSTIETLVLSLAVEHGSYDMLLWMDKNLSLPLTRIENDDGDLLQHQIARSPNVVKFMERLRVAPESMSLSIFEPENKSWCVNEKHETWVDILIQAGNCRVLELLLHTDESVDLYGKALYWLIDWDLSKILECSLATMVPDQNRLMRRIIGEYSKAMTPRQQRRAMAYYISYRLKEFMAQPFMQEFATAKDDITDILRLVRYGDQTKNFIDDIIKMGRYGFDEVFRRFYDLNACRTSVLRWTSSWRLPETQNMLVQFEKYGLKAAEISPQSVNTVSAMLVGDALISIGKDPSTHCHVEAYWLVLKMFALDKQRLGGISFLEHLKDLQQRDEDPKGYMSMYGIYSKRICELEDSVSLPARLRTLELLVIDGKMDPPIALDAIRFRQCGFLRWLVERNILKLESEASSDPQFNAPTWRKLKFLGGKKC